MAPPQQLRQQTSNCSLLLIYWPRKDERLSWPSWLTYSRWFTHISGHPSATGRAQDSDSTPAKDRCSTAGPRNQLAMQTLAMHYEIPPKQSTYGFKAYEREIGTPPCICNEEWHPLLLLESNLVRQKCHQLHSLMFSVWLLFCICMLTVILWAAGDWRVGHIRARHAVSLWQNIQRQVRWIILWGQNITGACYWVVRCLNTNALWWFSVY